ncbi:MltG/YceG/YrrL family protein [Paenibacillus cymbidii]|uniref:hypothetical protein n=1 Tax=Paenibacillus cymbidii TaxID=1639034 RepID=UPI001080A3CC|nr:hypothetical protein [Paenibacillus cymbidii]
MFKNRTLMTGVGIGLMAGAILLKLFEVGAGSSADWDEKEFMRQAEAHGLQVHQASDKLFTEAEVEAMRKTGDGTKASAAPTVLPSSSPAASPASTPTATPKASTPATPNASAAAAPSSAASPSAVAAAKPSAPAAGATAVAASPAPAATPAGSVAATPGISAPSAPATAQASPTPISVTIREGLISAEIVALLQQAGVVVDGAQLDEAIRKRELTTKIYSGTYSFAPNTSVEQIVDMLTTR